MDCPELERDEMVEKYVRGDLDSAIQDEFEVHLLECGRCLQILEMHQLVSEDLSQRAPQIRTQTPVPQRRFRWQWVAVLAVLIVACSLGLFRNLKQQAAIKSESQVAPIHNPPSFDLAKKPDANTSIPAASTSQAQDEKSRTVTAKSEPKPEVIARSPNTVLPLNLDPKKDRSTHTPTDQPTGLAALPSEQNDKSGTGATSEKTPKSKPDTEMVSDATASELFRLGVVQPPPYTFSGFIASTNGGNPRKAVAAGDPGAVMSNGITGPPSGAKRVFFQRAMNAYVDKRYDEAAGLLQEAIKIEPKAADANFFLGICRLVLGNPEDSIAPLKNTLTDEKSAYTQSAHFYLAKAYVQTNDLAQAQTHLQTAAAMSGRLSSEARSLLIRLQALQITGEKPSSGQPN